MRTRRIIGAIVLVAALVLLAGLLGGGMMAWPGMMHYGFGYGFGYRVLPWVGIGALLFRTLIAGAVLLFVVELLHRGRPSRVEAMAGAYGPLQIVRERYARGEIDREQFDQIRRDLQDR